MKINYDFRVQLCEVRSSPNDLVYAQVGARLPNAPIVPPSIDKVVYATIHSTN